MQSGQTSGIEVVHVGAGDLASQVVARLETGGSQVERISDTATSKELNSRVVVVFDGAWFEQRVDDEELHGFLKRASSGQAGLVVIGANTSELSEAPDKAGIDKLIVTETSVVRNNNSFNPPQAGFRLVTTGDGPSYHRLLFSNTNDPDSLAEALVTWLNGQ